jgi:DHA1 family tetracycline resistance protein-like MFS transporter
MTERHEKAKAFSMIGAVFGVAFLFGPALGGLSSGTQFGYAGTAFVATILSIISTALIYYKLPESLPHDKRDHGLDLHLGRELNIVHKFRRFVDNQFVLDLLFQRLFQALAFAAYTTVIFLYLQKEFGLNARSMGLTMTGIAIFSILNQAVVVAKVVKKLGELKSLYLSFGLLFTGLVFLPNIPTPAHGSSLVISFILFFLNCYIFNLGISLGQPLFKSLMTNHVTEKQQGVITGLDESLLAMGNAISPIIAGSLYTIIGTKVFFFYGGLLILPHIFVWLTTGKIHLTEPPHAHLEN